MELLVCSRRFVIVLFTSGWVQDAGDAQIFSDSRGGDEGRQDVFQRAVEALAGSSNGGRHAQLRNVMVDPKFEPVYEYVGESLRPCADCNIRGSSYGAS